VLKEEMVVVTAPRHPLSKRREVDAKALGRFPLILYESGSNTRKVIDQFFAEESVPARVAMETENVEIIKAMVASGLGITIVPYTPVAKDVKSGRFAYARLRGRRLYRETGWVFRKADRPPRAVTEMLRVAEALKGQFGLKPPRS
jgi:DNA-binding transcriptional LysR family regulator